MENLDNFYEAQLVTTMERMQSIMKKNVVDADDIDGMSGMFETKAANIAEQLDSKDTLRDLSNGKLSFLVESFYKKECKIQKQDAIYKRSLCHLGNVAKKKSTSNT